MLNGPRVTTEARIEASLKHLPVSRLEGEETKRSFALAGAIAGLPRLDGDGRKVCMIPTGAALLAISRRP